FRAPFVALAARIEGVAAPILAFVLPLPPSVRAYCAIRQARIRVAENCPTLAPCSRLPPDLFVLCGLRRSLVRVGVELLELLDSCYPLHPRRLNGLDSTERSGFPPRSPCRSFQSRNEPVPTFL